MAGGTAKERSLEETPTWAVAVVCLVLVVISIFIEHAIHLLGKWLAKRHKKALYEALEKIKAELMLLGFISLLLTVLQGPISEICIPERVANTWHPCKRKAAETSTDRATNTSNGDVSPASDEVIGRKLLWSSRRILAEASSGTCRQGKVPLVSTYGIHQLHIFIFVLAVSHVFYCFTTMALGRLKMKSWKSWERETKTNEYQLFHDPERFRFARDTSFGRRHMNFWSRSPVFIWIVCFFRQFVRSVPKVDYLTLRHGFIMAHLAPQNATKFDFQKYIKRSLEEDFKVVVSISPLIWFFAVVFLLFYTDGWYSYLYLPFIPLIVILLVGTKLQVIITRMALQIQDRGDVVKGVPLVQPRDNLFWFNSPRLVLLLIHFVLFQNAFQVAFFIWSWYEFKLYSCYHKEKGNIIIRLSMGIIIQILCSYVTLPLYALVTQMGSNMKPTIFNEKVATALRTWHHTAKKHVKHNKLSGSATPMSSAPATPTHGLSPVHLLRHYRGEADSSQTSARFDHSDNEQWDVEGSSSPQDQMDVSSSHQQRHYNPFEEETHMEDVVLAPATETVPAEHVRAENSQNFSFAKR
ncbi:MLO-like protein 6 [Aristolochia californica]|uniref:MLO-like protein 6 n=1 Tax=Aristolochia californica TaxID=171875 RepID=UPI0035D621E1